ncbi:hypothetical protein QWY31_05910 [Cytophagales bacterium LB-30]|uniref:Uncharacterized protein n=2 Tax=Shiella aurantiaca TaxID=3058365 RepID=A0ABT8F3J5_9BACT|nr:hypothetical protein [Shiella aurantiaca]
MIVVVLSLSCSKKADYDFIITNGTDYTINSFVIGSGNDRIDVTIMPNDTSEIVTYEFDGTFFNFTEPLLTLAVKQYFDSIKQYDYNKGGGTSIPDLKEDSENKVTIKLDKESSVSNILFELEIN